MKRKYNNFNFFQIWHPHSKCFLNFLVCFAKITVGNEEIEARETCGLFVDILRKVLILCRKGTGIGLYISEYQGKLGSHLQEKHLGHSHIS